MNDVGRTAVGSTNPVKVAAVERIHPGIDAVAVDVDSGVSEQPVGHAETRRGARTRARRALAADGAIGLGIGIEGGVARFGSAGNGNANANRDEEDRPGPDPNADPGRPAPTGSDLFLVMWAAATDGDRTGEGAGPALRLPRTIADRVAADEELGPVMDDVLGESDVARNRGAVGALTPGSFDREGALAAAVAGALGPFATDHYGSTG